MMGINFPLYSTFDLWTKDEMYFSFLKAYLIVMGLFACHLKTVDKSSLQELVQKLAFG